MLIQPLKKTQLTATIICLLWLFSTNATHSQTVADSLLHTIAKRFETQEHYKLETVIQPHNRKDGLPPDANAPCLTGREMLAVAVFSGRPQKPFARMLVAKHYHKKIDYDEHLFQDVAFDESLNTYYALVRVGFPPEANNLNCGVNLQVYDKSNPATKVWLLVFSK